MPEKMDWLIDGRIMLGTLWGEVTIEDINANHDVAVGMSETVSHKLPVHTILEGRGITKIPSLRDQLSAKFKRASNTGWIIFVLAPNRLYKFMGSTVTQITGAHFRIVETWQEAITLLSGVDETLPDLSDIPEKMEAQFKESLSEF